MPWASGAKFDPCIKNKLAKTYALITFAISFHNVSVDIKTLFQLRLSSTRMKIGVINKQTSKESSKSCSSTGSSALLHNEVFLKAAEFKFKYDFYSTLCLNFLIASCICIYEYIYHKKMNMYIYIYIL